MLFAEGIDEPCFLGSCRQFGGTELLEDVPVQRRRELAVEVRKSRFRVASVQFVDRDDLGRRSFYAHHLHPEHRHDGDDDHRVVYGLHGDGGGYFILAREDGSLRALNEAGVPCGYYRLGFNRMNGFLLRSASAEKQRTT